MTANPSAGSRDLPSLSRTSDAWSRATDETVAILRDLIRIPSVNPPEADRPDGELRAARAIAHLLTDAGLAPEVLEPVPGRGSVAARLRGDGTGGDPILLLSHLDVVPAPVEGWTHDPFAADLADGYVWGRGAVDMKAMVAMEIAIVRLLAAESRAAGRDPTSDPVPGLTRDVLFASTADEEAGGRAGAWWIADHRPELLRAAGALNECGGVSVDVGRRRFYPIGVAEKGFAIFRIVVAGTAGHGSMPRDDNAAVLAAEVVRRLAIPGPVRPPAVMRAALESVAAVLDGSAADALRRIAADDEPDADRAIAAACDATTARALRAVLRDTVSPNVIRAGVKYNVIPGRAEIEVDCRILPGTHGQAMAAELRRRIGDDLLPACSIELVIERPPVAAPAEGPLYELLAATLRDHDSDAIPVPVMVPFATDAKSTIPLGTPTYGFSPLRLEPGERFLDRFHGVDERVSLEAIRFGLPVLYDVVRRFAA
ncbi:MAG TPA: M20/M25/M40 family metallo-hydrolase [Candidatus Limnocylindrales bacterium]